MSAAQLVDFHQGVVHQAGHGEDCCSCGWLGFVFFLSKGGLRFQGFCCLVFLELLLVFLVWCLNMEDWEWIVFLKSS